MTQRDRLAHNLPRAAQSAKVHGEATKYHGQALFYSGHPAGTRKGAKYCFGTLLGEPSETAADVPPVDLRNGLMKWSTVDAPWLAIVQEQAFARSLHVIRDLEPDMILSSHLPPAIGMTDTLLGYLAAARLFETFVGPDQAALERMMAGAPTG